MASIPTAMGSRSVAQRWLHTLRLALRALRRDWQSGELRVLALALLIAVASVAAVGFFNDRVQQAMERKASELLGADLVIAAPNPIRPELIEAARRQGLQTAALQNFRSVVLAGDAMQLAEVKAAGPGYPLRGALLISDRPFGPARPADGIPNPGQVWVDERLLSALQRQVGDMVELGTGQFRIQQILTDEPDRAGAVFSIAPRVLMNLADVPATGLIQPGSRVEYRQLLAGEPAALAAFRDWAQTRLQVGEKLQGVRDARAELRVALERAQRFLNLAALVSVILAGVGVAIAARRFAARHWDSVAILRCVGATQGVIVRLFALELLALAVLAGMAGLAVGYGAQFGLSEVLGSLLSQADLPAPSWQPLLPALLTGFITLLGFGLPPLLRLRAVPPLRVLRRDLGPVDARLLALYGPAVAATLALLIWQAGEWRLALYVCGGVAGTVVVLALAAWGLVRALGLLRGRVGVAWRFGVANIARRGSGSTVQVVALGLGLMALLMLTLVRAELLANWRASLPADAPNHFLINIQPDEVAGVRAFLHERGLQDVELFPMVRGRLTAINDRAVGPDDYEDSRAKRLVEREFNLSWTDRLQGDNRIVAGRWWQDGDSAMGAASVEKGLAQDLGIALHDTLRFQVAGQPLEAQVTSLRSVEWDSFRANFFVVFPSGVLDRYPATWITSFHLPAGQQTVLADLVRRYPSVTVLDVDALMNKVREIMDRVSTAVEYVFLFTLAAGLIVLYAAIQATQDERRFESAILRTLGARRAVVRRSLLAEFALLGLLAGVLAAAAATLLGYVLASHVFDFAYRWSPWVWLAGGGIGMLGVGLAGLLGARSALNQPPWRALREL
ncbi:MAG TPA: FtsX-like permease family protein [Candidatus Competibacteraceae bacterium]|mgnify:CR=1 FL=1|nr:FtsX-like permease family protein [Candidatus Competibacteraceae bacterium]HQA24796.1 FtsX-like permease family protein [Candidatus Competibacteraceae bacterium]HQD55450.1 FtsX-like permease family protein [Candidatus Competibacteraceae bacterium]